MGPNRDGAHGGHHDGHDGGYDGGAPKALAVWVGDVKFIDHSQLVFKLVDRDSHHGLISHRVSP